MGLELYNKNEHTCILFTDLVDEQGDAVQANQVLIVDHGRGMLLDPGGNMTYNELFISMSRFFPPKELQYVFASHADPDIVASLPRWLSASNTRLLISRLWARFVPHFAPPGRTEGRVTAIPDRGGVVTVGNAQLLILPAHFLHSEGNFQVYDPISRILFSGDLGASMLPQERIKQEVTNLEEHLTGMLAFHRRYMVSNRACVLWAQMVSQLDIEAIVPQHGAPIRGKAAVARFIEWIAGLRCGIDLMTEENYRIPDPQWRIE
ncbi:beta-lactamase domain-containing protein [Burkholderiales bacterium GJ-E10]|nr:beta-lactamase domain-containing protein [Burkholderiales bacterium GJ-E10]